MKKLVVSLMALSLLATLSAAALEKPATEDVDIETYRIKQLLGEVESTDSKDHEKIAQLKALVEDFKERARVKSQKKLEELNNLLTKAKAAIQKAR